MVFWAEMQHLLAKDELIEVSAKLAKDSKEYMASKEALNSAMNKDERG